MLDQLFMQSQQKLETPVSFQNTLIIPVLQISLIIICELYLQLMNNLPASVHFV